MGDQEGLHPWSGEDQTAQRPGRDDVRDGRLAEDDRHLAEELAATQSSPLGPVDDDGRLAIEDDVEARPGQALTEDLVTLAEDRLLEGVDDALELGLRQVREQREAGDRIDQLRAFGHGANGARCTRSLPAPAG